MNICNGVRGHGGSIECCFSVPGCEGRAERFVARAALLGERFSAYGDRLEGLSRKPLSFGESLCVHGSKSNSTSLPSLSNETIFGRLFLKASASKDDMHESRSEELSLKTASAGKKNKLSKRKVTHEHKEKKPLHKISNEQGLHAETKAIHSKSDATVGGLQEFDEGNESWTDDEKHLLASDLDKLEALRLHALALEQWHSSQLIDVHRNYQRSAQNLLHYVALKSFDLEGVRLSLPTFGLASIKGIEGHVVASLSQTIRAARALLPTLASDVDMITGDNLGRTLFLKDKKEVKNIIIPEPDAYNKTMSVDTAPPLSALRSKLQLSGNTVALFGHRCSKRRTYIMVTLSEEVIENENLVLDLMRAGMDIARINCAHGSPEVWGSIIQTVKHCSQMLEKPCRVLMDLAGPKLRTSAFPPGPCVQKIKPHRDGLGNVMLPARVWIALPGTPVPEGLSADAVVPVDGDIWLGSLQVGDKLRLRDGRGKRRQLIITDKVMGSHGIGCWADCFETTFLEAGAKLQLSSKKGRLCNGYVAGLPPSEHFIKLKKGDVVVLTKESSVQDASASDANKAFIYRVEVSHTFGQLFECVKPGETIRFDDGRIEGVIRGVTLSEICVEVTFANEKGTKLGGEKSINLPNSNLSQKGLTVKDIVDLDFVVAHADMVALSFVNNSQDVQALQQALKRKGATSIGMVFKIETKSGVMNLPEILLQGMRNENPLGVMIARGDLAVEGGWESMAGVQEEILRICKAAHIPTIWATQVLEGLTKQGLPTRPEMTDAAFGGRAACVMLNKGLHILKAVKMLDRMLDNSVSPWWEIHASNQLFGLSKPS